MVSNIYQQNPIAMQATNVQGVPVDVEKLKQSANNSYVANRLNASASDDQKDTLLKAAAGTAMWYGIAQGMDVFNRNCASSDYNTTVMGKVGNWGDRVSTKFDNTSLGKFINKILNKFKKTGNWLVQKNDLAYSLKNHATTPEWSFAKTPFHGLHGYLAMDMKQVFDEYLEPINKNSNKLSLITGKKVNTQKLERYGMSQADINAFTKTLKGSYKEKSLMLQKKELELLGYKKDFIEHVAKTRGSEGLEKIAYAKKVRKLGFKSVEDYKRVTSNILENADDVIKALEKATQKDDIVVGICRRNGPLSKLTNHLIGRQVTLREYLNKYKATLGKGNSTGLGKSLSKGLGYLIEGCTNRWGGGKLAVAMQAFIFADMVVHTVKAPWGEKGKTLAERFVNDFTYFMALPFGIMAMHKVGGFKYAGMTTDQVKAYRNALEKFNADVKAGLLSNKADYKARVKELKNMLKADVKNPITKLFKKLGGAINIGNETRLARRSKAKLNLNLFRKLGNFFKNLGGVPLRIAIPMFMISPFLAKLTTQGIHKITGRPTKSVLDEETEEANKQPQTPNAGEQKAFEEAIKNAEAARIAAEKAQAPTRIPPSETNLLNQYMKRHQAGQTGTTLAQQPVRRYIPSPECGIPKEDTAPKYVPSSQSLVPPETPTDMSAIENVLKRVDMVEQDASRLFGRN